MTERAQALEALKRLARDIGLVDDVAGRRIDPDADHQQMRRRLKAWESEIFKALDLLAVQPPPPVGSPTTPLTAAPVRDMGEATEYGDRICEWCLWREFNGGFSAESTCIDKETGRPHVEGARDVSRWAGCPYCLKPLTVER